MKSEKRCRGIHWAHLSVVDFWVANSGSWHLTA